MSDSAPGGPAAAPFFDPSLRDVALSLAPDELLACDPPTLQVALSADFAAGARWGGGDPVPPQVRRRLGDERTERLLSGGRGQVRAVPIEDVADRSSGASRVLVAARADELEATWQVEVALAGTGVAVMSLKNDVHPALVSGGPLEAGLDAAHGPLPPPPVRSLVIVGVMRSGTYLLADLMRLHGVGRPEEHIRGDIASGLAARSGPADLAFPHWLGRLRHAITAGGWSSTKVVSHFLERVWRRLGSEERECVEAWLADSVVVRLVRSDKVLQAVSAHRALTTRMYRIITDAQAKRYDEVAYEYSFAGIAERLAFVEAQEAFLDEILSSVPAAPVEVVYEDLAADPEGVARAVVTAAGVVPRADIDRPADRRMRDDLSEEFAARFRAESGR